MALKLNSNGILGLLAKIPEAAGKDEQVSIDLVRAIDFGKHPDVWLREQMDALVGAQKDSKAKAQGLETFHSLLTSQLTDILPGTGSHVDGKVFEDDIIVD